MSSADFVPAWGRACSVLDLPPHTSHLISAVSHTSHLTPHTSSVLYLTPGNQNEPSFTRAHTSSLKHPTPRATILESALLLLVPWPVRRNAALVMQAWKRQRARSSSSSSSSSGRVSVSDDLLSPGLQDASLHDGSLHDGSKPSGPAPYVIAAVVGRQYVPMIRR